MKSILLLLLFTLCAINLFSQNKKAMTPDTYLEWNKISSEGITDNGNWAKYHLSKEKGDKTLKLYNNRSDKTYTYDRVGSSTFDPSGSFALFTIKNSYEANRALKRKKVKESKYPKDSLCIYKLDGKFHLKIPNVKSYKVPKKWGSYVAYLKEAEESTDTLSTLPKEGKKTGTKLIFRNLATEREDTLLYVKEYHFAEKKEGLAAVSMGIDSLMEAGVYIFEFDQSTWRNILDLEGDVYNLSWTEDGEQLSFTMDRDTTEERIRPYELYYWKKGMSTARMLADTASDFLPEGYSISNHSKPRFSEDGRRIFFGISQLPILQDTSLLDDEIVNVEVWHYDDTKLYTRQENSLKRDKKKDFSVMFDIPSERFSIIQDENLDRIIYDEKRTHNIAIGIETTPYDKYMMWKGHGYFDAYTIDLESKKTEKFLTKERGRLFRSPTGKYGVWYNATDKAHYSYNVETGQKRKITSQDIGVFYDERNDRPMDPSAYGTAGFTNDEEYLIVYDRYDLWLIDPEGIEVARRITRGREDQVRFRFIDYDREESLIDMSAGKLYLHYFNEKNKEEGYAYYDLASSKVISLYGGAFKVDRYPIKAKNSSDLIYTQESYTQFPDLNLSQVDFSQSSKISNANPQQSEYKWGSIQLHKWTSLVGEELTGLLVLPDDFDPKKKYPMIVNFYERSSDGLHRHRAPFAHRSTINYSYYSSKGYVIFNPDIVYRNGYPGQSCYDAVIPGVASVIALGFIDETKVGVQGHSWGGYQIADLLTKTDIFKCAESGAPVVNMISAYGGIRWGSGMSRMFQYEKTQSRLGATLWENKDLYLENSPIFNLDKVTTPVLILHNDEDGAVPWYQGIEYFNGLRRLGKKAWFLNYNGEPHWPVKWQNKLDFNIRMEQFFDHYLMGEPMPRWMKRGVPAIEKGINQGYEVDRN